MQKILVQKPKDDTALHQFGAFVRTVKGLEGEAVEFDMSQLTWVCPSLILPLSIYILSTGSTYTGIRRELKSYLRAIRFPEGTSSISEYYKAKTFIPLGITSAASPEWEGLVNAFQERVFSELQSVAGAKDAIYYPIAELVTNIAEHSEATYSGVFAQSYPQKRYVDLCIVDNGVGFKGGYRKIGRDFRDHDAIRSALSGISTKDIDGRGYGLRTSKEMICEGMGGSFYVASGESAFIAGTTGRDDFYMNIDNYNWQGVMLIFRLPVPTGPIDYSKYLE